MSEANPEIPSVTIGSIVHYVDQRHGDHQPAIVSVVNADGTVSLTAFPHGSLWHNVPFDADSAIKTWHWPEPV